MSWPDWRAAIDLDAIAHGPATCGCVPLRRYEERHMTGLRAGEPPAVAWTLCPVCRGTGVDPRIPVWT